MSEPILSFSVQHVVTSGEETEHYCIIDIPPSFDSEQGRRHYLWLTVQNIAMDTNWRRVVLWQELERDVWITRECEFDVYPEVASFRDFYTSYRFRIKVYDVVAADVYLVRGEWKKA